MFEKLGAGRGPDTLIAVALFFIALVVRLPFLDLVPPWWNSEIAEALDAAQLALGHSFPLVVPSQPHLGPVAVYPLAVVLDLVGLNPLLPRVVVAICGALTVSATFVLVRVMGGRWIALLAAGLLATNSFHILINSHIFWTNSFTPLLTTLAMLALISSLERATPPPFSRHVWLVSAFLLWGLALQSHPSVWTLVPGLLVAVFLEPRYRANLRLAWTWWAPLAGLAAYSNIIIFNLMTGLTSLTVLGAKSYALPEPRYLVPGFPGRVRDLALELWRVLSSNLSPTIALDLVSVGIAIWVLSALSLAGIKRRGLLFWSTISAGLLIAFLNQAYNVGYAERYVMFLVPMVLAVMVLGIQDLARWIQYESRARHWKKGAAVLGVGVCAFLVARPVLPLLDFYMQEIQAGRSNEAYLPWSELAAGYAGTGYEVLLDEDLNQFQAVLNGSDVGNTLEYLFRLNGVEAHFATAAQLEILRKGLTATPIEMRLESSGFELRQENLWLCLVREPTRRAVIIYPGRNGTCSG